MPGRACFPTLRARSLCLRLAGVATAVFLATVPLGAAHAFGVHEAENLLDPFPNIPGDPAGTVSVPFDVSLGPNTASGHFTCSGFGCKDNFDSFRMLVPAGLQITLSEFRVPRGQEPGNFSPGVPEQFFVFASDGISFLEPVEENVDWKAGSLIGITVFPSIEETFSVVLGPGHYDVIVANCCPPDTIVAGGSWEAEFTASVIPEPSTSLLVGSGLAVLSLRRKRSS